MLPLSGTTVVDATRMLPGAVLARMLLDLGARLVKVEQPAAGDMMRHIGPLVDGAGAGFGAFYRGAESVALDLRTTDGQAALRQLAQHADVLVESFRPGTLQRWELGYARLQALNPGLVLCSLPAFPSDGAMADQVGHDLNVVALSGVLELLGAEGMPGLQLADVGGAMLACSAVLAGLLQRARTGRGMHLEQPLCSAPLPFVTWAWADAAAGGGEQRAATLSGGIAGYNVYACADGRRVALGALEPKFWRAFMELFDLPELAGEGARSGAEGQRTRARIAGRLAEHPREHWLRLAAARRLPLSPVNTPAEAMREACYRERPLGGSWLPHFAAGTAGGDAPVPRVGEHTDAVLREFGLPEEQVARLAAG